MNRTWVDRFARFGFVTYGLVYVVIGWLAFLIATGDSEGKASKLGALRELAQSGPGRPSLWLVAFGMFALILWRLSEAIWGRHDDTPLAWLWAKTLGKAAVYGSLGVSAAKVAMSEGSKGGGTDSMTAKLMSLPLGEWLVGALGLAVIGYGVVQVIHGISEKHAKDLSAEGKSGHTGTAYLLFGKVGYIAKGVAMAIVGGLFCFAALTHDPQKSGGLGEALREVRQQTFGPWLLGAVAIGLAAYGLFNIARARHWAR